jgi:putative membrane protein
MRILSRVQLHSQETGITPALALILACYLLARVLEVAPTSIPRTAIVALDVLSAMSFALVDGARHYRLRGILIFAGFCIVVGNLAENLSIATGFPFGHYYFVELMGPKLFQVPVLLGLAYIGMSYVSWTVARLIVGKAEGPLAGWRIVALPAVASCVMVAWDLAQDPVWATVLHGWVWRDGGAWFGVPLSNYLGWYGTVFTIYLLFALYLRRWPVAETAKQQPSLRPAVIFYTLCAAGNVLQLFSRQSPAIVMDPTGKQWSYAEIVDASALVSIFIMGGFALIAWARQAGQQKTATD